MPLALGSRTAVLDGTITVEEAEPLAAWLRSTPGARVNLRSCEHVHTSALQALLAARVKVSVQPVDPFLRAWIAPLLARGSAGDGEAVEPDNFESGKEQR